MDLTNTSSLALILVILVTYSSLSSAQAEEAVQKRPKYLETRELEAAFKNLVYSSLKDLVMEGKLRPDLLTADEDNLSSDGVQKRGHQGLCWRRSNGQFRPFMCWKAN